MAQKQLKMINSIEATARLKKLKTRNQLLIKPTQLTT
jgi:hypothetical protein